MTTALQALIRDASTQLGSEACRAGRHQWQSDGGRGCPHGAGDNGYCGQAVYVCTSCGAYDYGKRGGPGHADCLATRGCEHRAKLAGGEPTHG